MTESYKQDLLDQGLSEADAERINQQFEKDCEIPAQALADKMDNDLLEEIRDQSRIDNYLDGGEGVKLNK